MSAPALDSRLTDEIRGLVTRGLASGTLTPALRVEQQLAAFRNRFGPAVLRGLDGEALLHRMHGRQDQEGGGSKCLAYWLEFKNDDEFTGYAFGGIGGGSAQKFGLYQRQADGAWMSGWPIKPDILSPGEAVAKARQQRDELLAGDVALAAMNPADTSDEAYARLQAAMQAAAPDLYRDGWAHKYWFLIHPDRLDDYHSPRYLRIPVIAIGWSGRW